MNLAPFTLNLVYPGLNKEMLSFVVEKRGRYRIAILGATSQIARDLIVSFSVEKDKHLHLFARRPDEVTKWLAASGLSGRYPVDEFSGFAKQEFDAVINFVGVGNPAQAVEMGNSISDITLRFDEMVLEYLHGNEA